MYGLRNERRTTSGFVALRSAKAANGWHVLRDEGRGGVWDHALRCAQGRATHSATPLRATTIVILALAMLADSPAVLAQQDDPILCVNTFGHTAGVRALAFSPDSARLYSAGMDKVVHVWCFPDLARDLPPSPAKGAMIEPWSKELPFRWEIARGLRGSMYCIASHPQGGTLAIGGYGARGAAGEIIRVDPRDGTFQRPLSGHSQSVWAMSFSSDGRWLASMDLDGQAMVWHENAQAPVRLTRPDREEYEPAVVEYLARRAFRPIAAVGSDLVALPHYSKTNQGVAVEIALYRASDGRRMRSLRLPEGSGAIRALAASGDGRNLAAACDQGNLCLWDLNRPDAAVQRVQQSVPVISLAFSPDGKTLVAGTDVLKKTGASELQVWDVPKRTLRQRFALSESVYACAVSPDGKRLAYSGSGGNDIVLRRLDQPGDALVLRGGQQIVRAALLPDATGRAFVYQPATSRGAGAAKQFDPAELQPPAAAATPPPAESLTEGEWRGELRREKNGVQVYHRSEAKVFVPLDAEKQGIAQTFCWIPGEKADAPAFAVGSDLQCGIYIYGLGAQAAQASLLRYYRGHHDAVTSLSVSRDRRFLLSASRDGTVRYWSLAGLRSGASVPGRWGAELAAQDGRLVVGSVDDLGPLHAKGVRPGDVADRILWIDSQGTREAKTPQEILTSLGQLPWDAQVGFFTSRDNHARAPFNCVGAWQQALAVYLTPSDEWIAWTPAGYYACSAGGERLIGWQINRGLGQKPSFYAAEQFSKQFYRPNVIKQLLEKGSLRAALAESGDRPLTVSESLPPAVKIIDPAATRVQQNSREIKVAAESTAPPGQKILRMWLQVDGGALDPLSTAKDAVPDDDSKAAKSWRLTLSPGRHKLAAWAESEAGKGQSDVIYVNCTAPPTLKPCLYVLSIGAASYPGRWKLKYADSDAARVASVFDNNSRPLFDRVEVRSLANEQVTKANILDGLEWLKAKLVARKNPEDVAVIFYSGHGWADPSGEFYLLPVDGVGSTGLAEAAERTCVSAKIIKQFCQEVLPCRLAIFLDACRSGAADVAGLAKVSAARDDLGRQLARSDCGVVLIASSKGSQDSREDDALKAGFFTKALVDGLRGKACFVDQDLVYMPHIYLYLGPAVSSLTGGQQEPVLNFDNPFTPQIRFPLTKRSL